MSVVHPVPVRWRPQRARRDRLAYRAETTPVEIRELPDGTFERESVGASVHGRNRSYCMHGGEPWLVVMRHHLDRGRAVSGERPATLAELGDFLSTPGVRAWDGLAGYGTPLNGTLERLGIDDAAAVGGEIPAAVLGSARADHAPAARAALARHLDRNLAISGGRAYMRTCPPVLVPGASPYASVDLPWSLVWGPSFTPHAMGDLERYMAHAGRRPPAPRDVMEDAVPRFGLAAYGNRDLEQFVQGSSAVLEAIAAKVARRLVQVGRDMPGSAIDAMERFRPLGDLGHVGAIPEELWGDANEALVAAAGELCRAAPHGYVPDDLPWLQSYAETVARPRIAAMRPAPPDADIDSIAALAP